MRQRRDSFLVYLYQYNTMKAPKIDATRRTFGDARDLDAMPPTVTRWANIGATTKREAIRCGRGLFKLPLGPSASLHL